MIQKNATYDENEQTGYTGIYTDESYKNSV